ncbi:hypothetical protein HOY82DRAFT_536653 [Tuber indicum]|nr:hypothetical protein HOY82DRAFT_536653 [Tuber indicum]
MSGNPGEGMSERPIPTGTSPCSKNEKVGSRTPVSSLDLSKEAPTSKPTDADPSRLAYTAVNPSNEVGTIELAEDSRAEEERKSRTAEFELRARKMGITRQESIAEKVAIWEGMWAAGQTGNDIEVDIPFFFTARYCVIPAN